MRWLKRLCLRIVFGKSGFRYMARSLTRDPRTPRARETDIVIRKDGMERRVEADWLKVMAKLVTPEDGDLSHCNIL